MTRLRVPLPHVDELDVLGDVTRRQLHEAIVAAPIKRIPLSILSSYQKTVGSEMVERYERGKGKTKSPAIVVANGGTLAIYNGNHRATAAVRQGVPHLEARLARLSPRPPIKFTDRGGGLMVRPEATAVEYREHDVEDVAQVVGGIAVINIETPLESKPGASWWGYFDDYESIFCRFKNALESDVRAVLLKIDSPGGAAAGLNACCDAMIRLKKHIGKPVWCYVDEGAYSAAYALACTADQIWLPKAGGVGSIGVVSSLVDYTEAHKKDGIRVEVVTSGKRKADGNPNVPISDAAIAHVQRRVDGLAKLYFKLVAQSRHMSRAEVQGFEADTFYGKKAVKAGLADGVGTLEEVMAHLGLDQGGPGVSKSTRDPKGAKMTKEQARAARAALDAAIAKGDALAIATASVQLSQIGKPRAGQKIVTTETKSTESSKSESSSSESEKEEEEEEESEKMPSNEAGSSSSSSSSSSSESEEEEEEEEEEKKKQEEEDEKCARRVSREAAQRASVPGADVRSVIRTAVASALADARKRTGKLHAVAAAARKVTGRKSLSSVAGALDAMPPVKQLAKEVETLKAKSLRSKVDGYLSKAKRSGRITEAQVSALRAQGQKDPKWLKGYLATLPKVLRGPGEEFKPRTDAQGNPVATLTADQEKIRNAMTSGMSAAERAEFDKTQAEIAARLSPNSMPRS